MSKEEINFEDWFKDVETINEIPPIPKDFKGMFKNAKSIDEIPPTEEKEEKLGRRKI